MTSWTGAAPRVCRIPVAARSEATDAAFLSASYGLALDPWQFDVLDGWLGVRPDGRLAAPRCGLAAPRQNGKNAVLEAAELFKTVALGRRILHTAHEVKTARKAFVRLLSFFDNQIHFPELAALVAEIRRTNGQELIRLRNGGSVEFIARSKGSGRGFTVDDLVMDEAQDLTEDQLAALLPTISAAPTGDPQQIVMGTPPPPDGDAGEVFWRVRTEGMEGTSGRLAWVEYGCDEDVDLDDEGEWHRANPSLGMRLSLDTVRDERAAMKDETFGRERLGIWGRPRRSVVIEPAKWAALEDSRDVARRPAIVNPVAMAVDVTPDRQSACVAVAAMRRDGTPFVEILESRPGRGTSWVVEYVAERVARNQPCAVMLDPAGPAGSLLPDLEAAGMLLATTGSWDQRRQGQVVSVSGREFGQACGAFYDAVMSGKLSHLGDPRLNVAVDRARKRVVGDAWMWHRQDPQTDLSPLVAATLALFGWSRFGRVEPPVYGAFGF